MRKSFVPVLLSLFLIPAVASTAWAQTPDEIIDKYIAAIGGRDALAKITSRRSTGTIMVTTAQGDIAGTIEIDAKAPNKSRQYMELDLSAMGLPDKLVIQQKFDGTAAWSLNSMQGDTEITGNQLDNMRSSIFPTPLLTYKTSGYKVEALPKEQVNGKPAFVLRATPKAGSAAKLYFDAETYLLIRTVATINIAAAGGDVEQTVDLSDFRTVDGVKVPFQVVNSSAAQTATIKLTKVEHNVPLADALFSAKAPTSSSARK